MIQNLKLGELKKSMKEEVKKKMEDLEKGQKKREDMNAAVAEDAEKAGEMEHDWSEALKIERNVLQILRLSGHIRREEKHIVTAEEVKLKKRKEIIDIYTRVRKKKKEEREV